MYIPLIRVHQGWEDEVFWFSTCSNLLHHQRPVPSVLADFPSTQSPMPFYGPTLFWCGTLILRLFGATEIVWRTFAFAGNIAVLVAIALLVHRLRNSWIATAAAAFAFSLSLGFTLSFSLPGRLDGWTLALIVSAFVVVARIETGPTSTQSISTIEWLGIGMLFGTAASTTPRCWPLLFILFATLPLLLERQRLRAQLMVAGSAILTLTLIFLPLHTTPWGHLWYVQHASSEDKINISPLMGGAWRFGHSRTQLGYGLALLVLIAVLILPRWRELDRFIKWLLIAGILNLAAMVLVVAGAWNSPTYWAFPLEICAFLGMMQPLRSRLSKLAFGMGIALVACLALLRVAREVPVFAQWKQRDPALIALAIRDAIPKDSLVYGPVGQFFYPVQQSGSDYHYLVERTTGGLLSMKGYLDRPSSMLAACDRSAYLVWPTGEAAERMPTLPHATIQRNTGYMPVDVHVTNFERLMARIPAGIVDPDIESFAIYKLTVDSDYCSFSVPQAFRSKASTE